MYTVSQELYQIEGENIVFNKMARLIISMVLISIVVCAFPALEVQAASGRNVVDAKVTQSEVFLNGELIWCKGFNISGNNYFKIRDLASFFSGTLSQFNVRWNGEKNAIEIITGKPYTSTDSTFREYEFNRKYSATKTTSKVLVDDELQDIIAYNIDGSNYFKLRDLSSIIPFDLLWDAETNSIQLYSQTPQNAYKVESSKDVRDNVVSNYFSRFGCTINSYLQNNDDKTISIIEAADEVIIVDTYDEEYNLIGSKSIKYELPQFGGFYSGKNYNYIAFGQTNFEENDKKEVIRIVRYDKSFNPIDSVSIKGGESFTVQPFAFGSGRMAEYGDTLVFHTSRERYTTDDGLNHQSQLTIIVDTSTMRVENYLGEYQSNHVSHSFDQYVLFDDNVHVLVDHGDAYPRSIVLNRKEQNNFDTYQDYYSVNLFEIPGKTGANCTGVSLGGFEITPTSYIVAMNTIDHSLVKEYTDFNMTGLEIDQRDIILCILPKKGLEGALVRQNTIAKYVGTDLIASIPQLVKISDDQLILMWQEFTKSNIRGNLKYIYIDEDGNATSEIQTIENFTLSNCKPIFVNNKIVWYANENSRRIFYTIPLD